MTDFRDDDRDENGNLTTLKVHRRRRIVMEEGCPTCAELARGSFGPSHDPSPRCESGKRPHCTCDICF